MKILISGYGKMGKMIEGLLPQYDIVEYAHSEDVTSLPQQKDVVCIDFTTPDSFRKNYKFLAENFKAVVVGTTGWYDIKDDVFSYFKKTGTTLIWASNFSIGVNVFAAVANYASMLMSKFNMYDAYIVEKHHCHKLDAPSGTAVTLANAVESGLGKHIDIQSVRCGEIKGIHTIGFESAVDRIVLEHEAYSREGFARGAIEAALLTETNNGIFEFSELIIKDNNE